MKKKIAIFGGSFNPPHNGHKKVIELVRESFHCDEIWLIPSGNRKDKEIQISNVHRLVLINMMVKELRKKMGPKILISEIEINRKKPTTTIDTLEELEKDYPDYEFYLIISSEIVPEIKELWHRGEEMFLKGKYIVIERPGSYKLNEIELPSTSIIISKDNSMPKISSTYIRLINISEELNKWVGHDLADYITKNKIYGFNR